MGKNSNKQKNDVATNKLLKLELAVKDLMVNFTDTNIHGMVNCIMRGWIQDGRFTEEYRELTRQAEQAMIAEQEQARERAEAEARAQQVREAIMQSTLTDKTETPTIVVNTDQL
jgi:hypothetical protein